MAPLMVEFIGSVAATLTTLAWLPQTLKTVRTRQTRDISLPAQIMLFIGIMAWLAYGVLIVSWPLIISNIITFGLVGSILALKLRHG